MPDLTLTFDPGSSLSKVIYQLPDGKPRLLLMEPEVIELSSGSIEAYLNTRGNLGVTRPEDDVWLQCSGSQQCQVVGYLARQFLAAVRMNEVKYERALYKVMAAVGAIAQQTDLPRRFSVAIFALLPYSEYQNAQRLQQLLKQHLKNYSFRGNRLQVKLETFECRPEGGGLAMARVTQNGAEWFQQQTLAVLMFGHRNTSLLTVRKAVWANRCLPASWCSTAAIASLPMCWWKPIAAIPMWVRSTRRAANRRCSVKPNGKPTMPIAFLIWRSPQEDATLLTPSLLRSSSTPQTPSSK
jgi:hypothetical protein